MEEVRLPYPLIRNLQVDRGRASIYLVSHPKKGRVVLKIWRDRYLEFFTRESVALEAAQGLGVFPELIEIGEKWVLMEYLEDVSSVASVMRRFGRIPLGIGMQVVRANAMLFAKGLDNGDMHIGNVRIDGRGNVRIIDLEHCYPNKIGYAFSESAFAIGRRCVRYDESKVKSHVPNYLDDWEPRLGVSLRTMLKISEEDIMCRRYDLQALCRVIMTRSLRGVKNASLLR